MVFARFAMGLVAFVFSALMVKSALQGLIRGLITMFVAAVALAVGISLIGSTIWSAIRRRRVRRASVGTSIAKGD